jgi:hypothetical protein
VLDPGIGHEYFFDVNTGDEISVGIWFVSPTATRVSRNVAILDANNANAESRCQRDTPFGEGDTNVAFSCPINLTGTWKVRVFGIEGESTGAYFITADRF